MHLRRLGRTEFRVSEIGYGLWGMGGWTGSDDRESLESLQLSVELGCNFFDSAWAYGDGRSDRLLGELIRRNPGNRIYAASKVPPKNRTWPASGADALVDVFPEAHVLSYAEAIRKALGVDCIDLLQFHVWHDNWASDERWMKVVRKLKEEGILGAFGLSLNRWEPANGMRALATGLVDAVQVIYNIFDQAPEDELFPLCRKLDVGVIARVPLDEGSLSGNLTAETRFPPSDWRSRYFGKENLVPTLERVDDLKKLVPDGMTLPQMALKFILANSSVSTTIVGMRKEGHVRANLAADIGNPLEPQLLGELRKHRWDRQPAPWAS